MPARRLEREQGERGPGVERKTERVEALGRARNPPKQEQIGPGQRADEPIGIGEAAS
ncbi:MAG: hypothetical protein LBD02_05870 [Christensenellaceae bacterium]|nr:hypothetical protein [Christensenellaceae bacterium]